MQAFLKNVATGIGYVSTASLWLAGGGLILMTALITAQVFMRYVMNDSIVWSEPLSVILMGWFIFLGAAVGIREGYHLSFDVLLYFTPEWLKLWLFSISDLVVVAFGVGMAWFGLELARSAWDVKLPALGVSGAVDFLPLVIGGVLLFIFSIERLARRAAGLPTARFGDEQDEEAA